MPKTEPRDHQLTIRIPKQLRDSMDKEIETYAGPGQLSVADIVVHALEQRYVAKTRRAR